MPRSKLALIGMLASVAWTVALAPLAGRAANPAPGAELRDRAAIQNLVAKYAFALDALDADAYASVFTEDAELTFGGNTYHGRAQIRDLINGFKQRAASRPAADPPAKSYHAITNTMIEFVNDHEAHHRSYWQTIRGPSSGPFTVGGMGVYEDVMVKRDGQWLIQSRKISQ